MNVAISALIFVVCILLILIVLVQNSKGGGLASSFSSSNQIMGVRKTTDFLEKATWTLAVTMLVLCVVSSYITSSGTNDVSESAIQEQILNTPVNQATPEFPQMNTETQTENSADSTK